MEFSSISRLSAYSCYKLLLYRPLKIHYGSTSSCVNTYSTCIVVLSDQHCFLLNLSSLCGSIPSMAQRNTLKVSLSNMRLFVCERCAPWVPLLSLQYGLETLSWAMQFFVKKLPAHIHLSLKRLHLLTRRLAATFWICCNTAPWTLLSNLSFLKSAALYVVATPWICWSHWWVNWSDGVIKQVSDKRDRSTSNSYLINVNMKVSVSAINYMCSPPTHFLPLTSLSSTLCGTDWEKSHWYCIHR